MEQMRTFTRGPYQVYVYKMPDYESEPNDDYTDDEVALFLLGEWYFVMLLCIVRLMDIDVGCAAINEVEEGLYTDDAFDLIDSLELVDEAIKDAKQTFIKLRG